MSTADVPGLTSLVVVAADSGPLLSGCIESALAAGPDVELHPEVQMPGLETPYEGDVVHAMTRSLLAEDPDALVAPYLMSGGTDAKYWTEIGMRSFGFAPLRLPEDLDFTALFHGVDERVPVDSLEFGARVFDRFLSNL